MHWLSLAEVQALKSVCVCAGGGGGGGYSEQAAHGANPSPSRPSLAHPTRARPPP